MLIRCQYRRRNNTVLAAGIVPSPENDIFLQIGPHPLAFKPLPLLYTRLTLLAAAVLCWLITAAQSNSYAQVQWQQLRARLSPYSVIGLGETGHGYESINAAKGTVVDFLHRQLGVSGVVFESSFTLGVVGYLQADSLDQRLKYALYPFWNTASVAASLKPFYHREQQEGKPLIAGCDVQEDCRFTRFSGYLLREGLVRTHQAKLVAADSILSYYIGKDFSRKNSLTAAEYNSLVSSYELIAAELRQQPLPILKQNLLLRCLQNRQWLCRYLTLAGARQRMHFRDSIMAENVLWLKNELYPSDKIALWAANTHVSRLAGGNKHPGWMGEWLSSRLPDSYGAISVQKGAVPPNEYPEGFAINYPAAREKFDAVIYLEKLKKISSGEWVTPCN